MKEGEIEYFMNEAILEGRKALTKCSPNPPVGCIIVNDGKIISRGHTNESGKNHAEAMAMEKIADGGFNDLTMFVTLEPCSFKGRTRSCAKEIVKTNIKNVYVGILDTHPKNQGAGIQILKKAGLHVEIGILEKQIHMELYPFLIKA